MSDTRACPFCAEDILAAAIKCKHCGEFLETAPVAGAAPSTSILPPQPEVEYVRPVWRFGGLMWRCIAHNKVLCGSCELEVPAPSQPGAKGDRFPEPDSTRAALNYVPPAKPANSQRLAGRKISEVGNHTVGGLACPKCGGTSFKAKRSAGAKALGIATVGVGAVLAPKTRVKCTTCGTQYVRG